MWRHDLPSTASKLAHSAFIILTLFFAQMKALDVFYQNIYHMYLAIVYIYTPIPKNALDDPAIWRHDPPSTASKLAHSVFNILTLFFVQMKALDVFYQNISYVLSHSV